MGVRVARGFEFLDKAERLLRWLDVWLSEVRRFGSENSRDDVERSLFSAIAGIGATQDALMSAASCWGLDNWKNELLEARKRDELVRFFYHARNTELHNSIVRWDPSRYHLTTAWRVVERTKFDSFFHMFQNPLFPLNVDFAVMRFLFEAKNNVEMEKKRQSAPAPIPERVQAAGIEIAFSLHGLILVDFEYTEKGNRFRVSAPENDAADVALDYTIRIHRKFWERLRTLGPPRP